MRLVCDYVVIGAGSAGCAIAGRLSEDPSVQVVLLDAGPDSDPARRQITDQERQWLDRPALFQYMQASRFDWQYWSEPQEHLDGRRMFVPRGRIVGGTSTFIAGLCVRGNPADYDLWAANGNAGWRYADVLPYFRESEQNTRRGLDHSLHGTSGPMMVADLSGLPPATAAFLQACREAGYARNDDFNGRSQDGAGRYQLYLNREGKLVNAANAYLTPRVRRRPNLRIIAHTQATSLIVRRRVSPSVDGVRVLTTRGTAHEEGEVRARCETIVSCGAIDSPKLLLLSGIGGADALSRLGIDVVCDRSGVGANLQDHLVVPIARLYPPRRGGYPFLASGIDGGLFLRLSSSSTRPDLQFVFNHALLGPPGRILSTGYQLVPVMLHPASRGWLALRSASPGDRPVIQPRFLSDARDTATLREGVRRALALLDSPAFACVRGDKLPDAPHPDANASDSVIDAYVRRATTTLFHPVGTCKMGPAHDGSAVVDSRLRVHGVDRLRVADASVIPFLPSGNVHTPTVMIGERLADFIHPGSRSAARHILAGES